MTLGLIYGGSNLATGLLSKEPEAAKQGYGFMTNPLGNVYAQRELRNTMAGAGDFGFGSIAKQGMGTLGQMFGSRGINPRSGVAMDATGSMLGGAMAQDAQSRRNYAMNLMTYSPGTMTAQGRGGPGWTENKFENIGEMYDQAQQGFSGNAYQPATLGSHFSRRRGDTGGSFASSHGNTRGGNTRGGGRWG